MISLLANQHVFLQVTFSLQFICKQAEKHDQKTPRRLLWSKVSNVGSRFEASDIIYVLNNILMFRLVRR